MKIAIVGPGSIGSTFAFHLARAGHDVTVVARGKRLARLEQDRAIVTTAGQRAPVQVSGALDTATAWDLVLVSVLDHQVEPLLPVLRESAAKQVMFMFNTFAPLDRLRDTVGAERFVFGFPAIMAVLDPEGRLESRVLPRSLSGVQITIVTDPTWAEVFSQAGIATDVQPQMHPWLRTHAAVVVPVMLASGRAYERGAGLPWAEARELALALREGLELVRFLGTPLTPSNIAFFGKLPVSALTLLLWSISRNPTLVALGKQGYGEARALLDAMVAAAPDRSARLRALRP